jgi:hypothetical protein
MFMCSESIFLSYNFKFILAEIEKVCINPLVLELPVMCPVYSAKDQGLNGYPVLCMFFADDFR